MSGWKVWCVTGIRRRSWCGGHGSCFGRRRVEGYRDRRVGGQERAHRAPLATAICGQGSGRPAEGRHAATTAQAADAEKIKQVVEMTLHETPPNATHWSVRTMAAAANISYSSVQRIWHAHGLKPHLTRPSRSLATRTSSPRSRTSLAFTSIRRTRRWFFPSTRRARSRRLTAPNRVCR